MMRKLRGGADRDVDIQALRQQIQQAYPGLLEHGDAWRAARRARRLKRLLITTLSVGAVGTLLVPASSLLRSRATMLAREDAVGRHQAASPPAEAPPAPPQWSPERARVGHRRPAVADATRQRPRERVASASRDVAEVTSSATPMTPDETPRATFPAAPTPPAETAEASSPAATVAAAADPAPTTPSRTASRPDPARTTRQARSPATAAEPPSSEVAALRASLHEWISATNGRDFETQMAFYPPILEAFYRARHVPREAVLAEKTRVFADAALIDIRAGQPDISLEPGDRRAAMRFRKQYVIDGGRVRRRGEVVQELRWEKTDAGWQITSERDIEVIR